MGGAIEVPAGVGGHVLFVERPGVERFKAQVLGQAAGVHRYVPGAGWHRSSLGAGNAHQQARIVAADPVDDLGDLVKGEPSRSAGVVQAGQVAGQHGRQALVEAIGVGRRADFGKVERGRLGLLEAVLNPVDGPGVAVPAISQQPGVDSFEIDLTTDVPNIVVDQSTGARFIFLYVQAMSGFSENGFEIWAGPPDYVDTVPSEVNARNLHALNNPGSHSSDGVTVYGLGNLPMNSNFSNPVDIPLIYVGPDMIGQNIQIRMFDSDSGAQPPVIFYFDSIAFTPDDSDPLGYDPDLTDWAMSFGVSGQDDPDGVAEGVRCLPGNCDNQWIDPAFRIEVPGNLDNCDYDNPTMEDCTPFFGGRLVVRYDGGFADTYGWEITIEGLPFLVK